MESFLSFLTEAKVEEANVPAKGGLPKKQRNPDPAFIGIRVWVDGSVYPSEHLVKLLNLEYPTATVDETTAKDGSKKKSFTVVGDQGNGFDVIDTRKWSQMKSPTPFIAVAVTPKDSPKLDLFGMTRYDENGAPLKSVLEQGTVTFGKETLLPLILELYNIEPNEEGFVDCAVLLPGNGGVNFHSESGIELLPKVVSRGADKGKPDYVRRENIDIFALVPDILINPQVADEPELDTAIENDESTEEVFVEEPSIEVSHDLAEAPSRSVSKKKKA